MRRTLGFLVLTVATFAAPLLGRAALRRSTQFGVAPVARIPFGDAAAIRTTVAVRIYLQLLRNAC